MIPLGIAASSHYAEENTTTPGDYATGLALWLRADDLSLSNGAAVNSWADQSGAGNDAVATVAPTFTTNIANGGTMPAVRFNGSTTRMNSSASSSASGQTIIAVFSYVSPTTNLTSRTIRGSSASGGLGCRLTGSGTAATFPKLLKQGVSLISGDGALEVAVPADEFHWMVWRYTTTQWYGQTYLGSRSGSHAVSLDAGYTSIIGAANNAEYSNLYLAEFASWDLALSDSDIANICGGLANRWGTA